LIHFYKRILATMYEHKNYVAPKVKWRRKKEIDEEDRLRVKACLSTS